MGHRMFIKHAGELVTCAGAVPKAGKAMNEIGIVADGALIVEGGSIAAVGTTSELARACDREMFISA